MQKFKRKFVSLNFDEKTEKALLNYAQKNGFDLTHKYDGTTQKPEDFHFHTTIFYTDSEHQSSDEMVKLAPFKVVPVAFEMFGKEKNIPVLKLKLTNDILELRKFFEGQGFKDSWPDYKPHVSLSYKFEGDIKKVPLPDFSLTVNSFMIKNGKDS